MRVTEIRGRLLRAPLPEPIGNSTGFVDRREALLVELRTDAGLSGWGECWQAPAGAAGWIRGTLAPAVLGSDPLDRLATWQAMQRRLAYDRRGTAMMAASALDLALWDLAGQALGLPLWRLLGGRLRERVPAYASGPFLRPGPAPYAGFAREVEGFLRAGFRAVKPRAGVSAADDAAMARELRQIAGPDALLMFDLNEGFGVDGAIRLIDALAEARPLWIEEPLAPDDLPGYRALARRCAVSVAAGEALAGLAAVREILETGALSVLQPDLAVCGGLTLGQAVAALAAAREVAVVPHVWGTAVNFRAALHWAATLPGVRTGAGLDAPLLEWDRTWNPFLDLGDGMPELGADGAVAVPEAPGLGLSPRAEMLERWTVEGWTASA